MREESRLGAAGPERDEQDEHAAADGAELVDGDLDAVAGGTTDGGCIPPFPGWPN